MDFWLILTVAAVTYTAFKLGQWSILLALKQHLRDQILAGTLDVKEVVDTRQETVIEIEQHQGNYYAFANSGEFLAQGQDFDTMFGVIKQRFPGRDFRINRQVQGLSEEQQSQLVSAVFKTFGDRQ